MGVVGSGVERLGAEVSVDMDDRGESVVDGDEIVGGDMMVGRGWMELEGGVIVVGGCWTEAIVGDEMVGGGWMDVTVESIGASSEAAGLGVLAGRP